MKKVLLITIALFSTSMGAKAQAIASGIIKGRVIDKRTGNPITAAVIVYDSGEGTICGSNGNYVLEDMKAGTYKLSASFPQILFFSYCFKCYCKRWSNDRS